MNKEIFDNNEDWAIYDTIFETQRDIRFLLLQDIWNMNLSDSDSEFEFILTVGIDRNFIMSYISFGYRNKMFTDYDPDKLKDMLDIESPFRRLHPKNIEFVTYTEVLEFLTLKILKDEN